MNDLLPVLCGVAVVLSLLAFGFSLVRCRRVAAEPDTASAGRFPAGILLIVLMLTSGGVTSIWLMNKPQYRATAVVRISPNVETIVFKTDNSDAFQLYPGFVNTEVAVIHSPTVLERVLDQSEIRETEWFKLNKTLPDAGDVAGILDKLAENLEVVPRSGTELVDVAFSAAKPDDAKTITNLVVQQYKRLKDETERMNKTRLFEELTSMQAALQMEIDGLQKTKFNISRRFFQTDKMDELRQELSKRFNATEAKVQDAQNELDLTRWELKSSSTAATQPNATADLTHSRNTLEYQIHKREQGIQLLQNDLNRQRGKLAEAGEIAQEIANYDEKIKQKREVYDSVRKRRERLEVEEKAPGRVRVAAYAVQPSQPFNDRRALLTGIVVAAATIVSLSVVALRPRT